MLPPPIWFRYERSLWLILIGASRTLRERIMDVYTLLPFSCNKPDPEYCWPKCRQGALHALDQTSTTMHGPERPQTLKAIASAQFSRVASSNVVNRAADIASRIRAQAVQSYSQAGDNEGKPQQQQGWGAWAWEKLPKRGNSTSNLGIEKVMLFPGWATRRYRGREGECMHVKNLQWPLCSSTYASRVLC